MPDHNITEWDIVVLFLSALLVVTITIIMFYQYVKTKGESCVTTVCIYFVGCFMMSIHTVPPFICRAITQNATLCHQPLLCFHSDGCMVGSFYATVFSYHIGFLLIYGSLFYKLHIYRVISCNNYCYSDDPYNSVEDEDRVRSRRHSTWLVFMVIQFLVSCSMMWYWIYHRHQDCLTQSTQFPKHLYVQINSVETMMFLFGMYLTLQSPTIDRKSFDTTRWLLLVSHVAGIILLVFRVTVVEMHQFGFLSSVQSWVYVCTTLVPTLRGSSVSPFQSYKNIDNNSSARSLHTRKRRGDKEGIYPLPPNLDSSMTNVYY